MQLSHFDFPDGRGLTYLPRNPKVHIPHVGGQTKPLDHFSPIY
ncbi:hypothetical protein [Pedobacter sp. Leaf216]|nr:hypothetical protein [Pedobacter sp. Leaf216]